MSSNHTLTRCCGGDHGYRRLARLVARAFYAGECPPREEAQDDGPSTSKSRSKVRSQAGLGVLLIDALAAANGYVDEAALSSQLRLAQKDVRRALRHLEAERLLAAESVRFAFRRTAPGAAQLPPGSSLQAQAAASAAAAVAAADDEGEEDEAVAEARKRHETRVYWAIDYARLIDALRLRLHLARAMLKEQVAGRRELQLYVCTACGCRYSSLDAARLLHPATGAFRCDECGGEVGLHVDAAGAGGPGAQATTRERVAYFRGLSSRLEVQLMPLAEQVEKLRGVAPPDPGTLQDWFAARREAAERRARRAAAARARAGAAGEGMSDEALLEWADRAEVQVDIGGEGAPGAGPSAPARELPAWFRAEPGGADAASAAAPGSSPGAASGGEPSAGASGGAGAELRAPGAGALDPGEERQRLEAAYIQQYMAAVRAAREAAGGAGGTGAPDLEDMQDAKRLKTEGAWSPGGVQPGEEAWEPKKEEEAAPALEEELWEDVAPESEQQQAEQQAEEEDDKRDVEWQEV